MGTRISSFNVGPLKRNGRPCRCVGIAETVDPGGLGDNNTGVRRIFLQTANVDLAFCLYGTNQRG